MSLTISYTDSCGGPLKLDGLINKKKIHNIAMNREKSNRGTRIQRNPRPDNGDPFKLGGSRGAKIVESGSRARRCESTHAGTRPSWRRSAPRGPLNFGSLLSQTLLKVVSRVTRNVAAGCLWVFKDEDRGREKSGEEKGKNEARV